MYIRLLILTTCLLCYSNSARAEWRYQEHQIFGTNVSIQLWAENDDLAEKAMEASVAEMWRIHNQLSPYIEESELSQLNNNAYGQAVTISDEMSSLIDKSLYFGQLSNGAFDITFASVGYLYDYREGQKPTDEEIERLKKAINFRLIEFSEDSNQVRFLNPDVKIDLGGIAKGYAIDQVGNLLREIGIEHAAITAGGDSLVVGDKRGEPWIIGIRNPRSEGTAIRIPLENAAISTSGDYERFFIDRNSGERIHHILNPQSGTSATGISSVTVIGPNGFDTDPLSTTLFVLGIEKGMPIIERLAAFDAIFIDSGGKVHYSSGLLSPQE